MKNKNHTIRKKPNDRSNLKSSFTTFGTFDVSVIVQVFFLAASALFIGWALQNPHLQFTIIYFSIIFLLQIWVLIFTIRRNTRKIKEFLLSIKYGDTPAIPNPGKLNRSQQELFEILLDISKKFGDVKSDKETEHQFFLNTVRHVNVGLLAFDETGNVKLANHAAKKLLCVNEIRSAKKLNNVSPGLGNLLMELRPGKPVLKKITIKNEMLQLSVNTSLFNTKNEKLRLVSLQDIKSELQQEEIYTWQKLISILRHEIMNSIGPIVSLSKTLLENFEEFRQQNPDIGNAFFENSSIGLSAIKKRSTGLMHFVDAYRTLSKIPKPVFEEVNVKDVLNLVGSLMADNLDKNAVKFSISCRDAQLSITADEKMVSQVLINLVNNAIQALQEKEDRIIEAIAYAEDNGCAKIMVRDNGAGISNDILEKIFIPFFTTKKEGSGIGLSLSRQIMQLHGGSVSVQSKIGEGTTVVLKF